MSSRKRSGSRYSKKIDIQYFLVSYEGGEDERKYFESMKNTISRQFENLVFFIPVEKSDVHHSSPQHVLKDLENKANQMNYKLNSDNVYGFIAFDVDHYFSQAHQRTTKTTIQKAKQKGVYLIISNPAFDIWPLLHYENIALLDENTKKQLITNSNQFLKKRMRKALDDNNSAISELIPNTSIAIDNNHSLHFDLTDPPKNLGTSMQQLIELIKPYLITS